MSAKLIVHKFENGYNCRSLMVTIEEKENELSETNFSSWLDSTAFKKKTLNEKSSRLVVKIVTGSELNNFNLDSCAKLIDTEINTIQRTFEDDQNSFENYTMSLDKSNDLQYIDYSNLSQSDNKDNASVKNSNINQVMQMNFNNLCPLEYSLERVKENNARIMENIHMLNRTLNYTKKKEILGTIYPKPMRSYPCETCGKCFVYETGLRRHYTMRHAIMENHPRWQVVWTCINCFQVWPQQDLALQHSKQCSKLESLECVREIKTSSLLQCEFCEKVFTSIPRLLRHTKMHSTRNNYECSTCETAFVSFREAEDHWLLCPWLKAYYCFNLPKLLLCNSCDRKFRNYEQLYNHRYKIGHFIAKNSSDCIGSFVFQCEVCGACFPSVQPLKVHKKQCHPCIDVSNYNIVSSYNNFYSAENEPCNVVENNN